MSGNLLKYDDCRLGLRYMHDGYQVVRATVSFLIGQDGIGLAVIQTGLVNAQMGANVLGMD